MLDRWAEVSIDFNPIHVDPEFAESSHFRSTISHGTLTIIYLLEMMTDWLGHRWLETGRLTDLKFIAPVRPGDTVTPRGKVIGKYFQNGFQYLECDVWLENQNGISVIVGKAIVSIS
jgi:3-hydroxybutyryl-CoA dehydratase